MRAARTISGGLLKLANQAGIPDNSALTLSGGTLDLGGYNKSFNQTANFSSGGAPITNSGGSATVNLTAAGTSMTIGSLVTSATSNPVGFSLMSSGGSNGYSFDFTNAANNFNGGVNISNCSSRHVRHQRQSGHGHRDDCHQQRRVLDDLGQRGHYAGTVTVSNNFVLNTTAAMR